MLETPNRETRHDRPPALARRYLLVRADGAVDGTAAVLAWDSRLKRWRTIQIARPGDAKAAKRLLAGAQQAAKIEHPALERVVDMDTDGGVTFVVRDRLVTSMDGHLKRHGAVAPEWATRVVARLAEGLEWAHGRGFVHGHPRPDVVRFAEDGTAVLTGFGDAGVVEESTQGRVPALNAHLAPELRQRWHPTPQTDVYALGALLYTLLAGRHSADLFYAEAYEGLLAPVPPVLRPIIERACAYDPNDRFSAAELHEALLASIGKLPAPDGAAPPWLDDAAALPASAPDIITMDPLLAEIAGALGSRPQDRAVLVDDGSGATLDPETGQPLPYVMPTLKAKDPGFRDPFEEVTESDLPEYVDKSVDTWKRRGLEHVVVKADGSVAAAPVRTHTNPDDGATRTRPLVLASVLAVLLAGTVLVAGGGLAWYAATANVMPDSAFVELVRAESATIGSIAAGDSELEAAWFAFVDARGEAKGAAAAALVTKLEEHAATAPLSSLAEASVERMKQARDAWEASR